MKEKKIAQIGIIGGSGFYDLVSGLEEIKVETPYGSPSEKIAIGEVSGKKVAFLPRHGKDHNIPPHLVNCRANIFALKSLGVERIITSHAVGSLQENYQPGDLVVVDQFVDRTKGRPDTFFDGPVATHVSTAFPYCPQIRELTIKNCREMKLKFHDSGTMVVIQGPRFSTAAESLWFTKMGWHIINMTGYPEVALAREQEICYTAIGVVTDYDCGLVAQGKVRPVSVEEIIANFKLNIEKIKNLMTKTIENWPDKRICECGSSLARARF
ncbi:S-methyl-5'-thioadenosine phosphorylase [Patescibacteria group bacterium]|nr:S-methyl-5'-thioadenosine phosphorylase [Patescibacteria group bacterium]